MLDQPKVLEERMIRDLDQMSVLSVDFSEYNVYTTHPNQSLLPFQIQR